MRLFAPAWRAWRQAAPSIAQTPLIGAPLPRKLGPGELFGFGRAGRFLRGRELRWR